MSNANQLGLGLDLMKMEWMATEECPIGLFTIMGWTEEMMNDVPDPPPDPNSNKGGETYTSSVGKRPLNWDKE